MLAGVGGLGATGAAGAGADVVPVGFGAASGFDSAGNDDAFCSADDAGDVGDLSAADAPSLGAGCAGGGGLVG